MAFATIEERFYDKIAPEWDGGCWRWSGGLRDDGYGRFWIGSRANGHDVRAHRWAYELLRGPIPDEMTLDHLCHGRDRNCLGGPACPHRACVNPWHLEPVTGAINVLRGRNSDKTHCVNGHEFTAENTYYRKGSGHRMCRACGRANQSRLRGQ